MVRDTVNGRTLSFVFCFQNGSTSDFRSLPKQFEHPVVKVRKVVISSKRHVYEKCVCYGLVGSFRLATIVGVKETLFRL